MPDNRISPRSSPARSGRARARSPIAAARKLERPGESAEEPRASGRGCEK